MSQRAKALIFLPHWFQKETKSYPKSSRAGLLFKGGCKHSANGTAKAFSHPPRTVPKPADVTYLSVAFVSDPLNLNLFPPHDSWMWKGRGQRSGTAVSVEVCGGGRPSRTGADSFTMGRGGERGGGGGLEGLCCCCTAPSSDHGAKCTVLAFTSAQKQQQLL